LTYVELTLGFVVKLKMFANVQFAYPNGVNYLRLTVSVRVKVGFDFCEYTESDSYLYQYIYRDTVYALGHSLRSS
jgi:hypothetical protein